jgi:hypothetical protein
MNRASHPTMNPTAFVAQGRGRQGAAEDRSERTSDVRERGPQAATPPASFLCDSR